MAKKKDFEKAADNVKQVAEQAEVKRGKPFKTGINTVNHLARLNQFAKITAEAAKNAAVNE